MALCLNIIKTIRKNNIKNFIIDIYDNYWKPPIDTPVGSK